MLANYLFQSTNPDQFLGYLLLAYVVMWLITFGYILSLWVQQRAMKRDIDLLRRLIEQEREDSNDR